MRQSDTNQLKATWILKLIIFWGISFSSVKGFMYEAEWHIGVCKTRLQKRTLWTGLPLSCKVMRNQAELEVESVCAWHEKDDD